MSIGSPKKWMSTIYCMLDADRGTSIVKNTHNWELIFQIIETIPGFLIKSCWHLILGVYFHHCWHDCPSPRGGCAFTASTCANHRFIAHWKHRVTHEKTKHCFGHIRNPAAICAQLLFFKHRWGTLPALGGVMQGEVCPPALCTATTQLECLALIMMSSWIFEIEFKTETCQIFHQQLWSGNVPGLTSER
jgi:hypothetical protein